MNQYWSHRTIIDSNRELAALSNGCKIIPLHPKLVKLFNLKDQSNLSGDCTTENIHNDIHDDIHDYIHDAIHDYIHDDIQDAFRDDFHEDILDII